jgi:hypothetical protein
MTGIIHGFAIPPKGLYKIEAPNTDKKQLSTGSADAALHRYFSAAGETDELMLSVVLGQTSQSLSLS